MVISDAQLMLSVSIDESGFISFKIKSEYDAEKRSPWLAVYILDGFANTFKKSIQEIQEGTGRVR